MPKIYDLTHVLHEASLLFPGTPPLEFKRLNTIHANGFAETQLTFTSHVGTHVDAPAHLISGGKMLNDFPADRFWGAGFIVDCRGATEISQSFLAAKMAGKWPLDFLLLATGQARKWPGADYLDNFPVLTSEAAHWLVRENFLAIGMDAISFDPVESRELPIHRILLGSEILLVENLKIPEELLHQKVEIIFAPLSYRQADGAPVRVLAKLIP